MNNVLANSTDLGVVVQPATKDKEGSTNLVSERRIFLALVILSFPVFMMVALERRMAGAINKDIGGNRQGLITEAKEYATSTIALAFQSQ